MRRLGLATGLVLLIAAAWAGRRAIVTWWTAAPVSPPRATGRAARDSDGVSARGRGDAGPRGFPRNPTSTPAARDRSWAGTVWPHLRERAELELGRPLRPSERAALLHALERERYARKRLQRAERSRDGRRIARARERFLDAAREADGVSQDLFGVPMAVFVLRAEGEEIEEVQPR